MVAYWGEDWMEGGTFKYCILDLESFRKSVLTDNYVIKKEELLL